VQRINLWMLLHSKHLEGRFAQILQSIKPQHKTAAVLYSWCAENIPSTLTNIHFFH